jgi:hypothetical protein
MAAMAATAFECQSLRKTSVQMCLWVAARHDSTKMVTAVSGYVFFDAAFDLCLSVTGRALAEVVRVLATCTANMVEAVLQRRPALWDHSCCGASERCVTRAEVERTVHQRTE